MEPRRRVAFGPIRSQRIGAACSIPLTLLITFGRESVAAALALALVGVVSTYRALRMGIEIRDNQLIVRNLLSSISTDLSDIQSAQFRRARGALYRLVLERSGGERIQSDGASALRRAFPELGTDETRQEKRARESVMAFLEGTQVTFLPASDD
jgi:hypothetical protein